jgi:hypothetical protein
MCEREGAGMEKPVGPRRSGPNRGSSTQQPLDVTLVPIASISLDVLLPRYGRIPSLLGGMDLP